MIVYLIAFAISIFFVYLTAVYYKKDKVSKQLKFNNSNEVRKDLKRNKFRTYTIICFILSFLPLFLLSAARYGIGTDYFHTYVPAFNEILNNGQSPFSEIGFTLLIKLIQVFTSNSQWLFIVTSFIFVSVLLGVIIKYSDSPSLSVVVVFLTAIYFVSLNNVRQSIAAVIMLAAVPYIADGKIWKFILCELLACVFHYSALIMFIPYVLIRINRIRRNFLGFSLAALLLSPILSIVFKFLISLTKYQYFLTDYYDDNINTVSIIINLVLFAISYIFLGKLSLKNNLTYTLLVIQFLLFDIYLMSVFLKISELISRTALVFQIFQVLLIPHIYKNIKAKNKRIAFLVLVSLLYGAYFTYFIIFKGAHEVLPYQWIFNIKWS